MSLLNHLFPTTCLLCKRKNYLICPACQKNIKIKKQFKCPWCRKIITKPGYFCIYCSPKFNLEGVLILYKKNYTTKKIVQEFLKNKHINNFVKKQTNSFLTNLFKTQDFYIFWSQKKLKRKRVKNLIIYNSELKLEDFDNKLKKFKKKNQDKNLWIFCLI